MRRALWVLALSLSTQPLWAATEPSAEQLIKQGLALRQRGKDAEALELFRRAYALEKTPRGLAQIALAQQALGEWIEGERGLLEALERKDDPWITSNRSALEGALKVARGRLGTLEVRSNVAGAELKLNGRRAGVLPLPPIRVIAGSVVVELAAPGYWPLSTTLLVSPDRPSRENLVMVPKPPDAPLAARTASTADQIAPKLVAVHAEPTPSRLPLYGWIAAGGAGAGLAVGVIARIMQRDAAERYNDDQRCLIGGRTRDENCLADRQAVESGGNLAAGGFIGAGVLAALSATLFLIAPSSADAPSVALGGSFDAKGGGVTLRGRFD